MNTVYGEINDIDLDAQIAQVGNSKIDYDELIIGLGCEDKYHNVPGAEEYTHSIQTLSKAGILSIVLVNYQKVLKLVSLVLD
ncbi:hypothetical protein ACV56Z_06115 [Staphylococcus aureus]